MLREWSSGERLDYVSVDQTLVNVSKEFLLCDKTTVMATTLGNVYPSIAASKGVVGWSRSRLGGGHTPQADRQISLLIAGPEQESC